MTVCAWLPWHGGAHQIPSLTVEAMFATDRSYSLRINLDPRLFLSDQPTTLPPVPIEWYRDQTPAELAKTEGLAQEYLHRALKLRFGELSVALPKCSFQPMDGATNLPVGAETKEVHLLAEAGGRTPDGGNQFQLILSRDANTSMILLNSFDGRMERRPNAVFPGEGSRPFLLAFPDQPEVPVLDAAGAAQAATPAPSREARGVHGPMSAMIAMVAAAVLILGWGLRWILRRRQVG